MERLTLSKNHIHTDAGIWILNPNGRPKKLVPDDCDEYRYFKKLTEYEDLEEQGKLLRLPCKIGEAVFVIDYDTVKCPHCLGLDGCYECNKSNPNGIKRKRFTFDMTNRFGKDVFLTQEQAELALKEMEGENE